MSEDKIALGSLALDLKRIAIGYFGQSSKMAERFCEEALRRKEDINSSEIKPYLKKVLGDLPFVLAQSDKQKLAEDALMYSTIVQNYALSK